jgi:hypothetical protein
LAVRVEPVEALRSRLFDKLRTGFFDKPVLICAEWLMTGFDRLNPNRWCWLSPNGRE